MKALLVFAAVLGLTQFAHAAQVCDQSLSDRMAYANDRYSVGDISIADLSKQEVGFYKEMKTCGAITDDQFCMMARPKAKVVIAYKQQEVDLGTAIPLDVVQVANEMAAEVAPCQL